MGIFSRINFAKKSHQNGDAKPAIKKRLRSALIFLSLIVLAVSSLSVLVPQNASAATSTELDSRISKNLYRNAFITCLKNSPLKDDSSILSPRDRITELNATSYKWFASDSAFALDVLAGPILKSNYGSTTVKASGDVSCGNPAFIIEALKGIGYLPKSGDIDSTFRLMCTIGFQRDGGDRCGGGHGDWYRVGGTVDTFTKDSESKRKPLNDGSIEGNAAKYVLGLSTFKAACKTKESATVPESNVSSKSGITVKVFNGETVLLNMKMVDHWFEYGNPRSPFSITALGVGEGYSIGIVDSGVVIIEPPGSVNIGGGIRLNPVGIGSYVYKAADGVGIESPCGALAQYANKYQSDYLKWAIKNPQAAITQNVGNDATTDQEDKVSCAVEGIGWILCPAASAIADLTDGLFTAVSAFLKVAPVNLSPDNNPLFSAWATMRTIANIAFVIVFLLIIFSQLSSIGVSNYGVKKMLPRLVVAAILVNVSFYVCALAIDLSNIIGTSLQDVFKYIEQQTTDTLFNSGDSWGSITKSLLAFSTTAVVGGVALSVFTSGGVLAALAGLLPLLFSALFALIVAFVVLLARQAIIIMLVVLAPLAFVAYLLPNTETLFKKWRDLSISMLALFPMMSIVFGGSQLAAVILRQSSNALLGHTDDASQITAFFLYIGSFAVQAIPFFITPVLIKLSSGVLGRFAGLINNPNKGPIDRAKKWAESKAENAQNRGYMRKLDVGRKFNEDGTPRKRNAVQRAVGWSAGRRAKREAINANLKKEAQRAETGFMAATTQGSARLRTAMAGSRDGNAGQRIEAAAINAQLSLKAEDVKAGNAILENLNLSGAQRQELALTGKTTRIDPTTGAESVYRASETLQKAAIERQMTTGSFVEKRELIEGSATGGSVNAFRQLIAGGAASAAGLATADPALAGRRVDDITQGKFNYDDAVVQAFAEGKYTSEALVTMHNDARQELLRVATQPGNENMLKSLQGAVAGIEASPEIKGKAAGNGAALADMEAIKGGAGTVVELVQSRQAKKQDDVYETYVNPKDGGPSNVPGELKIRQDSAYQTYADAGNIFPDATVADIPISTTPAPPGPVTPTSIPPAQPTPPVGPDYFGPQNSEPPKSDDDK